MPQRRTPRKYEWVEEKERRIRVAKAPKPTLVGDVVKGFQSGGKLLLIGLVVLFAAYGLIAIISARNDGNGLDRIRVERSSQGTVPTTVYVPAK